MSDQPLKPQTELRNYVIRRVLGRGSFGVTYLAEEVTDNFAVAIKEYFPLRVAARDEDGTTVNVGESSGTHSEEFQTGLEKFLEESRTLSGLSSPHIVQVVDTFEYNGTAYMVMKYEEGGTLNRYLLAHQEPLRESQILSIFIPLLEGLRTIHAKWLLHRDIKPENIYIRKDGSPLLIDFGTARHALSVKQGGMTELLTPGYAPPEQYDRNADHGPWTDIYAVGATMYYCVTRIKPYESRFRTGGKDPVIPASMAAPALYDRELLKLIEWMMQPDHGARPQSVEEVLAPLQALRDGVEARQAEESAERDSAPFAGDDAGTGEETQAASEPEPSRESGREDPETEPEQAASPGAEAAGEKGKTAAPTSAGGEAAVEGHRPLAPPWLLLLPALSLALALLIGDRNEAISVGFLIVFLLSYVVGVGWVALRARGGRRGVIKSVAPLLLPPVPFVVLFILAGMAPDELAIPAGYALGPLTALLQAVVAVRMVWPAWRRSAAWSGIAGTAIAGLAFGILVTDYLTLPPEPAPSSRIAWSPDGEWLAFAGGGRGTADHLFVAAVDGPEVRELAREIGESPAWSPTGDWIAYRRFGGLELVSPDGKQHRRTWRGGGRVGVPAWSPDGAELAFWVRSNGGGHELHVVGADGVVNRVVMQSSDFEDVISPPAWDPSGAFMATAVLPEGGGYQLYVIETESGKHRNVWSAGSFRPDTITWSPDGLWIYVSGASREENVRNGLYRVRPDYIEIEPIDFPDVTARHVQLSPDGRRIAFESDDGVFVANPDGSGLKRIASDSEMMFGNGWPYWSTLAWGPSGRRLVRHVDTYFPSLVDSRRDNIVLLSPAMEEPRLVLGR